MKTIFTSILILLLFIGVNAQSNNEITISGFTPEVETMMIKGDMVSYFILGNSPCKNANVEITSSLGSRKFFASFDLSADANGHYAFEENIMLKAGPSVTFEGELELLVWVETIFGNEIWTRVKRTKENLSDPIILDRYTNQQGSEEHARNQFELRFDCIGYNDELKAKVTTNGDSWKSRKIQDFHFLIKNKGDEEWKVNLYCTKGTVNNKKEAYVRHVNDNLIDFSKPIIYRAETRTLNGNILWHEEEIEARGLNERFFGSNYTKLKEGEWENIKNNTPTPAQPSIIDEEITEEIFDEVDEVIESEIAETAIVNEIEEQENKEEPIETPTEGASDLTTKTLSAKCANMKAGDSIIVINGTTVCIQSIKPAGSRAKYGTLSMDCNFEVGNTIYPLKGGSNLKFSIKDGSLISGTLRADTKATSSAGQFILKSGTDVNFSGTFFTAGKLLENATLEINGVSIEITPNSILERDIRFDGLGRLVEATFAHELKFNNLIDFKFPPLSRYIYKTGELSKVYTPINSTIELNGKTYTVNGSPDPAAYEFDKSQRLESIISGANNIVNVNGIDVTVKIGTPIQFIEIMNTYEVEKFFTAEEVTLVLKKGNKEKEVTYKAGKKIVLDEENR